MLQSIYDRILLGTARLFVAAFVIVAGYHQTAVALTNGMPTPADLSPLQSTMKQTVPVAVFGDDDRVPLPRHFRELDKSIGFVTSSAARTICTAFCVGRRTVATAAHCLFRTAGERRPDLGSFRFEVGRGAYKRQSAINGHRSGSYRQHVIAGSATLSVTPPIDATRDWALMRLEHPACRNNSLLVEKVTPNQIERFAARGRLLHVAYHGDLKKWRPTISRQCSTSAGKSAAMRKQMGRDFSDTSALVLHNCDSGPASSGSPLLAFGPDNSLRVVGMNVGTYHQTRYLVTGRSVTHRYKPATVANTAVSGSAFADHILAFTRADILDSKIDIRQLQAALADSGFDPGGADGIYGPRTRAAVLAFEATAGRPELGLATQQLLRTLERSRRN